MNPYSIAVATMILTSSIIFGAFKYFNNDCPDLGEQTVKHFQDQQKQLSDLYQDMLKEAKTENSQLRETTESIMDALEAMPEDKQKVVELRLQLEDAKKQLLQDQANTRWQGEQAEVERKRFEKATKEAENKPCTPQKPSSLSNKVFNQGVLPASAVAKPVSPITRPKYSNPIDYAFDVQAGVRCEGCVEVGD